MIEVETRKRSEEFARANRKRIAKELTDISKYIPDDTPISVFMAGSPGAGKTEFSKSLVDSLEIKSHHKVIRIDGDELRERMPGYTGNNSYLFNTAVSLIVEKIHDFALHNRQTFLLDGTFSKYTKANENVSRSLHKQRPVLVFYVYQRPEVAWRFTQAREAAEGRNIPKDAFIEQFINAKETIDRIRKDFRKKIFIFLVKKNFETGEVEQVIDIQKNNKPIDDYFEKRYTRDELEKML
ncbi:MAG: Zeta toxin [Candidatus Taylorbacteria bacterium CG11_big_fil_rev_8_21_14_0_20_46_11]|uniref:Zeta toxin n=1 Tax=Candidatus Taylorbacteria bacterium CG11_big_fil_rev_8_21_14_0_20_46_11 TaxID=1975025 RepID=A0A2H0KCX4_9BACT|nr:MAG: Zeta toxin [Candidatus Taylorbacteria bacterium CG11_big_fil_rev_8_21_14_0_20_46_11]